MLRATLVLISALCAGYGSAETLGAGGGNKAYFRQQQGCHSPYEGRDSYD
jgi:hypothetical protein